MAGWSRIYRSVTNLVVWPFDMVKLQKCAVSAKGCQV